jgi:predicted alpha/beta hydrolase family esterase
MRLVLMGWIVHSGFKARMFPDEARSPRSLAEHMKRHMEQVKGWFKRPSEAERKQSELPVRTPYGQSPVFRHPNPTNPSADSIREGIQIVADHLTKNTGIHSINVYFTGHSLGCATASLAYARAVAKQNTDYKSNVRIRDAYLFAAPVIGDTKSRDAFNDMMASGLPRSMWRVTNVGFASGFKCGADSRHRARILLRRCYPRWGTVFR